MASSKASLLPSDVLRCIAFRLPFVDLAAFSRTCKRFHSLLSSCPVYLSALGALRRLNCQRLARYPSTSMSIFAPTYPTASLLQLSGLTAYGVGSAAAAACFKLDLLPISNIRPGRSLSISRIESFGPGDTVSLELELSDAHVLPCVSVDMPSFCKTCFRSLSSPPSSNQTTWLTGMRRMLGGGRRPSHVCKNDDNVAQQRCRDFPAQSSSFTAERLPRALPPGWFGFLWESRTTYVRSSDWQRVHGAYCAEVPLKEETGIVTLRLVPIEAGMFWRGRLGDDCAGAASRLLVAMPPHHTLFLSLVPNQSGGFVFHDAKAVEASFGELIRRLKSQADI
jgi:hypothetical protein